MSKQDELDRFALFYNDKDKFDKLGKAIQFFLRTFINVVPAEIAKDIDTTWRYILDARKVAWMFKWIQEAQTVRAAMRADGDPVVVRLRTLQRFSLMLRWFLENLHIMLKIAPKQKLNIFNVQDHMTLNRMAKGWWLTALIAGVLADQRTASTKPETSEQKKMRQLRLVQSFGDSQICFNVLAIPQKLTLALIGKEKAYMESYIGFCGFIAASLQCYFLYPAKK